MRPLTIITDESALISLSASQKSAWPEIIPDDLVKNAENNQYLNGTAMHPLAYVETPVVKKQQDELHRRSLDPSVCSPSSVSLLELTVATSIGPCVPRSRRAAHGIPVEA